MPNLLTDNLIYKSESYKIVGAAMNVHKELGSGFLEAVYQEAFEIELSKQGEIPFLREARLEIMYKGVPLQKEYIADFICFDKIIVELKAVKQLDNVHEAQLFNYLKATGYKLGLLINFGEPSLKFKRIVKER